MSKSLIYSFLLFLVLRGSSHAFVAPRALLPLASQDRFDTPSISLVTLGAKKRRRRKKANRVESESSDVPPRPETSDEEDLPDFDLGASEESVNDSVAGESVTSMPYESRFSEGGKLTPEEMLADMDSLIRFDGEPKVDPNDILYEVKSSLDKDSVGLEQPAMGKKKARQARRQAEAIARQNAEESDDLGDFLSSLPLIGSEREDDSLKIVETGTWVGIALLVAWEVYINSPFFERQAPLAPVVYDFFL